MNFFSSFKYAYKFYNIRQIAMDGDYYSALSKAIDFLDDLDDDKKIPVIHLICSIYKFLGDFDNELKYAKKAVVLKPSSFNSLYDVSVAFYNLGKYDDALKYCNSAWENYDGDWKKDDYGEWILIDKGNILFGLGRVDEAKELFKCLLSSKSNEDVNIWLSKGIFFYKIDDYETAMDCLDKALNIGPNTFGGYAIKSSILHKWGKFEEAAEFMDTALKIKDSVDETWYIRAFIAYDLKDYDCVLYSLNKFFELGGESSIEDLYIKAESLKELGHLDESLNVFKEVLDLDSNYKDSKEKYCNLKNILDIK